MYIPLILVVMLHRMLWYFSLIEGTITLLQMSIGSDLSGIDRFFITTQHKLIRSFGRYSCQFFFRNFSLGYSFSLQKSFIALTKFISSPVHSVLSRLSVLVALLISFTVLSKSCTFFVNVAISRSFFLFSLSSVSPSSLSSSSSSSSSSYEPTRRYQ